MTIDDAVTSLIRLQQAGHGGRKLVVEVITYQSEESPDHYAVDYEEITDMHLHNEDVLVKF
ncbi:MAG: hypothetical protein ACYTBJ_00305 [Planctomycetota bacterium]